MIVVMSRKHIQVMVRVPESLHESANNLAQRAGQSVDQFILNLLKKADHEENLSWTNSGLLQLSQEDQPKAPRAS